MIIKGLFRRYERWNPVHPTSGAFWGMGIGIGCGVGWGPGFGPEVIGYVGAGCGAGFSVGFTFLGFGIGFPANYVYTLSYKGTILVMASIYIILLTVLVGLSISLPSVAILATRSTAIEIPRPKNLLDMRNVALDGWSNFRPRISGLQQEAYGSFRNFRIGNPLEMGIHMSNMRNAIFSSTKPVIDQLERIRCYLFNHHKGSSE